MLWTVCSEETDVISMLMLTFFVLLEVLCMHDSDVMLFTA